MGPVRTSPPAHAEVLTAMSPLARYVRARTSNPQDADDVIQEVLTRMLSMTERLAPDSAVAYSIVTARHLLADASRDAARLRRIGHRVIDLREPQRPDDAVISSVESAALHQALTAVPKDQREILLAHVLHDRSITDIAAAGQATPGSVAAQLARTRAKVRLDYVLALRRTVLPTPRCRPILLSLSAGDTRRQLALRAGQHLLTCRVCAAIAPPLLERQRSLAAVVPWLGLGPLLGYLRRMGRSSTGPLTAAASVVAVAATAGALLGTAPQPSKLAPRTNTVKNAQVLPSATPQFSLALGPAFARPTRTVSPLVRASDGRSLLPMPQDAASMIGDKVVAHSLPVAAVPADEGFWAGDARRGLIWVQLSTDGRESRPTIRAGDTVSFAGTIVAHDQAFARRIGVNSTEGERQLDRQPVHIAVRPGAVTVSG